MRKTLAVALLLTATTALADRDECRYEAARRVGTNAAGITKVVVHGVNGSLHVDGRQGVAEVVAAGKACTSDEDLLPDINLTVRRSGSELHFEAHVPEKSSAMSIWYEARLDFGVTVPAGVAVEIHDGSGETKVTNVGAATIADGSGSLIIANVRGNLSIRDGSGEIDITDVTGNVTVEDGSGDITIRNVSGAVDIEDASGSIRADHVKQDILIRDDGSGGVRVSDVGGDFTVRSKGSGGVSYARVTGRVSVPRDHRHDD